VFNLADTAIVIGAILLAISSFGGTDERAETSETSGPGATGSGGAQP